MDYSLFSSTGNLIDSFDNEAAAQAALERLVATDPEAANDVALFVSNDEGQIVAGPIHALPTPAH